MIVRRIPSGEIQKIKRKTQSAEFNYVGYWTEYKDANKFINPNILIDEHWHTKDKDKIIKYLDGGNVCARYLGWSDCRICKSENGSLDLTDGKWIWPEGLSHYVKEHNVRLPEEFINYMDSACADESSRH